MSEHLQTARRFKNAVAHDLEAPVTDDRLIHVGAADAIVPKLGELEKAVFAWMSLVFVLCYAVLPVVVDTLGLFTGLINGLAGNLAAFAVMLLGTMSFVAVARPEVRFSRTGKIAADPVIAATSGGLLVWAILHNVLPVLTPFEAMPSVGLATFVTLNIVESALFGMMLASFAKSSAKAFVLGAGFQAGFMLLAVLIRFGAF